MVKRSVRRSGLRMRLWYCCILLSAVIGSACAGRVRPKPDAPTPPAPIAPSPVSFSATAYCKGTVTAAGMAPAQGMVAADPAVLPLGSRIRLSGLTARYDGDYVVRDTGAAVRGRRIDLYIRDCREAVKFGRRAVAVSVLH